ncbi:YbgC/FadM family acyl-CoA thioesterase [Thiomonas sp. FB-Cd]|uniref:YbgC/FadM family acyl-CoA thioesterase n=1 Tax=Thiomonas sp. FB-Cd TaxID=1158292 RepID=UPI0004DFB4FB|nr:YbgC/FadM family acyl-CoA thioesterase [Thiomonas sp. FB-Cd]
MTSRQRHAFGFFHRLQVRWAEVDMQQVVFNGHYLLYFDTAMSAYWKALGLPYMEALQLLRGDFYVKKASLTYHSPARLDDWIDVGIEPAHLGRSSMTLRTAMYVQDRLLVDGEIVYVFTTLGPRAKAQTLPPSLRELLQAHAHGESMLQVQLGTWAELGGLAAAVRTAVFVHEQGIPAELEWDAFDTNCLHAVVRNRLGQAVACGRLLPDGHIGRVAVVQALRGSQAGRLVMKSLMGEARAAGHAHVEISAQSAVAGFYRKLGFVSYGEPYDDAGIPHIRMRAALLQEIEAIG